MYLPEKNTLENYRIKSNLFRINMAAPQGCILTTLLFLVYINDFPKVTSLFNLFIL